MKMLLYHGFLMFSLKAATLMTIHKVKGVDKKKERVS
jgi:hypothetical protein